ncbi:MAG: ATP-binding protein [Duncaniella sp.]|nr:ATP-binding protein [Duncaniella sp.]MDE6824647.1 ATP-binding protein [Duncaniella sp.]MDE7474279.1 ATP-binding protein [Duncaniella sp.]
MNFIERPYYMSRLLTLRNKRVIKVITGVRRSGKSTLLEMFRQKLMEEGVDDKHIIHINFDDYEYVEYRDPKALYSYIKSQIHPGETTYLMFDEIQNVKDFPEVINSFYLKPEIDIYLTGSNAYMLSGEIATLLSGRYVEIKMLPISFKEYVNGFNLGNNLAEAYRRYIDWSTFPYAYEMNDRKSLREYLSGLYSTIVLKDINQRYRIADMMMLESVIRFAADNIGNLMSTKRIADILTAEGRKIDIKTAERYLTCLAESFLLMPVRRFDIKGKQFLKTLEKYYIIDIGLRSMLLGRKNFDVGRILENIVYLTLAGSGKEIYIGKTGDMEVDFVSIDENGTTYYQVAATVRDNATLLRELASLRSIPDHHPKILLTLDEDPEADYDGIRRINALEWMMKQ